MEQPLKARLIGASILVVLAVALVPELLSGPKHSASGEAAPGSPKGTRTFTIDLGGAVDAGARLEPRPDTEKTPASPQALPTVGTSAPAPAAQSATIADESAPTAATPPPATAAAKGGYSVQVGAFGSDATARKLVNDLKADGLPAYIAPLSKSGKTLHRVRVGPVPDRAAADKLAAQLKGRGLPVSVVPGG